MIFHNHHFTRRRLLTFLTFKISIIIYTLILLKGISISVVDASIDPIEGRYSFSLTTFSPTGKLPQLSHALKASTLGPPIIATCLSNGNGILFTSLQHLPSPLIQDDGTSRFIPITKSILLGHSGVSSDGRILSAAAQRLAIEHEYTFEEEIPMEVLLEEMALLCQEYTMKAGSRPFGCTLLIAHLSKTSSSSISSSSETIVQPQESSKNDKNDKILHDTYNSNTNNTNNFDKLYRIDPSGSVTSIGSNLGYIGRGDSNRILKRLQDENIVASSDFNQALEIIVKVLREEIGMDLNISSTTTATVAGSSHNQQQQQGMREACNLTIVCGVLTKGKEFKTIRIPFLEQ